MNTKFNLTPFLLSTILVIAAACFPGVGNVPPASPADTPEETAAPATPTITPSATKAPIAILPTPTEPGIGTAIFRPSPGTLWQWQLDTPVDLKINAQVFDIDMFDNNAAIVQALHARGIKVICYISAGTRENWRPDASKFPRSVLGRTVEGYEDERWLDIRQIDLLAPIMTARMDLCKQKGFDGLEPDNIDGYTNRTGFPLTAADQLRYNRWLAQQAHLRGLSIGLKNDGDQAAQLVDTFDWALVEECFAYDECDLYSPFISAGRQVVDVEYTGSGVSLEEVCPLAKRLGIDLLLKDPDLTAFRRTCP